MKFSARNHPGQLLLNWDCRGAAAEVRQLLKQEHGESSAATRKQVKKETDRSQKNRYNQERRA